MAMKNFTFQWSFFNVKSIRLHLLLCETYLRFPNHNRLWPNSHFVRKLKVNRLAELTSNDRAVLWVLTCMVHWLCFCHVTYAFRKNLHSVIASWTKWLNIRLRGCGLELCCSHWIWDIASASRRVPWQSGYYKMKIQFKRACDTLKTNNKISFRCCFSTYQHLYH